MLLSLNVFSQSAMEQHYFEWAQLPFPKEEFELRRQKVMQRLSLEKLDILLIPSKDGFSDGETFRQMDDFQYFTGLELPNSILAINIPDNEVVLFAPDRDPRFENASRSNDFPGRPLADDPQLAELSGISNIQSIDRLDNYISTHWQEGKTFCINGGQIGKLQPINHNYFFSWDATSSMRFHLERTFPSILLHNAYLPLASVRMVKSPRELDAMMKAADITIQGIKTTAKYIRAGVDERSLEGVLEGEFKKQGSPRLPFASIIKSGPNSLWPWRILASHYNRRNRVMQNGELVIFDVGCEYNYYVSDIGRTFPVSGKFTDEQKRILKMELAIADSIIQAIRPGITFADLKKVADRVIPANEKKYMQVGLHFGHHLGLSSGDPSDPGASLEPGMVFTVEPWYYNHDKEIAVFTEDEILVTVTGFELLTKSLPRTPEALEEMMISN